jgi:acetylornithine deacetylase/succinyl-diaminopimelate desuccinylase-like protein
MSLMVSATPKAPYSRPALAVQEPPPQDGACRAAAHSNSFAPSQAVRPVPVASCHAQGAHSEHSFQTVSHRLYSPTVMETRDLDDPAQGVRFNWTVMSSGSIRNQIPDRAVMTADTRHLSAAARDQKLAIFAERLKTPTVAGTSATMEYREGRPGYLADEASRKWIDRAVALYTEIDGKIVVAPPVGGGTDAGFAQLSKKPVVEGLGLPGFGFHSSEEEYVDIDRIPARIYLAARMIIEASR